MSSWYAAEARRHREAQEEPEEGVQSLAHANGRAAPLGGGITTGDYGWANPFCAGKSDHPAARGKPRQRTALQQG